MTTRHTVLCTVGTSLLQNLQRDAAFSAREAFLAGDWAAVAEALGRLPGETRLLGAELNSLYRLGQEPGMDVHRVLLLCSDTEEGERTGQLLRRVAEGWFAAVTVRCVEGLQDADPQRFRTVGLRNLARILGEALRQYGTDFCAINATGGYKAQVAIAVVMGQALGVPVYYLHERFASIVEFPPLPVSLDVELWAHYAPLFQQLERNTTAEATECSLEDGWDERLDALIEREDLEGKTLLALTPMGQVFHEAVAERLSPHRVSLPATVPEAEKRPPRGEKSGHFPTRARDFAQRVTSSVPYVVQLCSYYHNPDLSRPGATFRLGAQGIEAWWSDGTATVKFRVEVRTDDRRQLAAAVRDLQRRATEW